ncbi:MAG: flap endonuclease [Candidatus Binatia bacterium]|nr:flap endonuclease [Candidatus Binatia bacterium]
MGGSAMELYLVDGTYELFRAYYGAPRRQDPTGAREVGAVHGMLASLLPWLATLRGQAIAVATDHVIESFRNHLYPGYKSSAGVPRELLDQFSLAEDALRALGLAVWPMVEFEADDAMATAAARFRAAAERTLLVSPDKDFAQCVRGQRVIVFDRHRDRLTDEAAVVARFGVYPESVPDWLALVGDPADGIPGIPGFGPRSATAALQVFRHLEHVPLDATRWPRTLRNKEQLVQNLRIHWSEALLFKTLATLRVDAPLPQVRLEELRWLGVDHRRFQRFCAQWGFKKLAQRAQSLFPA